MLDPFLIALCQSKIGFGGAKLCFFGRGFLCKQDIAFLYAFSTIKSQFGNATGHISGNHDALSRFHGADGSQCGFP